MKDVIGDLISAADPQCLYWQDNQIYTVLGERFTKESNFRVPLAIVNCEILL